MLEGLLASIYTEISGGWLLATIVNTLSLDLIQIQVQDLLFRSELCAQLAILRGLYLPV